MPLAPRLIGVRVCSFEERWGRAALERPPIGPEPPGDPVYEGNPPAEVMDQLVMEVADEGQVVEVRRSEWPRNDVVDVHESLGSAPWEGAALIAQDHLSAQPLGRIMMRVTDPERPPGTIPQCGLDIAVA